MKHHKKNSKRQKLSLKYNIQKRVRESKRRIRKEAKKLGVNSKNRNKKDPGIPNSWPFKAEMLQELERKKEQRDQEIADSRAKAKAKAKKDQQQAAALKRRMHAEREDERRRQRAEQVASSQAESLRKVLTSADVILEVLDARDPMGCRCAALEAWAQEQGKRLIFVLAKADLVSPHVVVRWMKALGQEGVAVAVSAEAGREGIPELLRLLGRTAKSKAQGAPVEAAVAAIPEAQAVGVVGYAGTGKKALLKAMRQEAKAAAKWLLEAVGNLKVVSSATAQDANAESLSLCVRGMGPKGDAWQGATATKANKEGQAVAGSPIATVSHLLERAQPAGVMRRFRLQAFSNVQELLGAFAKDRKIKSRKGKEPAPEAVARRLLAELPTQSGCCCAPSEATCASAKAQLWTQHGAEDKQAALKTLMEVQAAVLVARDPGPHVSALELASRGVGPAVDIAGILAGDVEEEVDADEDMDDSDLEGGMEEGEEEEDMEGDESEAMSDDDV